MIAAATGGSQRLPLGVCMVVYDRCAYDGRVGWTGEARQGSQTTGNRATGDPTQQGFSWTPLDRNTSKRVGTLKENIRSRIVGGTEGPGAATTRHRSDDWADRRMGRLTSEELDQVERLGRGWNLKQGWYREGGARVYAPSTEELLGMLGTRKSDLARITVAGCRGGTVWVSSIETLGLRSRHKLNTTLPDQTEWTWVLVGEPTVRQQGQEEFDEELTTPIERN